MEQTLEELLAQKTPVLFKAAHVSIRQLAEKLRSAMKDASKGGQETKVMQFTFGLPFLKSLKLWCQAVSRCEALRPLLQPLVIVILSAIRAKETHLLFAPYVSILLGLINDLALNCKVFIPIASSCLSTLTLCANRLGSKTLTAEGREPNITDVVRVSERQLKDRRVVRGLTVQIVTQLTRHTAFLARTSALPEVGWVILQSLKKLSKSSSETKQELTRLITALEQSIAEVKEKRTKSDELFQFEFSQTGVGRLMQAEPVSVLAKADEEGADSSSESEQSSEEDEAPAERSKRSLKRERQKEKKKLAKLAAEKSPEEIVDEVGAQVEEICETEVVPFTVSDDDEE
jgi:nucleolar complex protein 2